jgi:hypothetical protein
MTGNANNETNRRKFPLEIILVTSYVPSDNASEFDEDEFDFDEEQPFSQDLPTVTVECDGQQYESFLGNDLIKNAFDRAFALLGTSSVTDVKINVDLRQASGESNIQ